MAFCGVSGKVIVRRMMKGATDTKRSKDCKFAECYGHRGSIFQHNRGLLANRGRRIWTIGAKDALNADLWKKWFSGQLGLESLIIGAKDVPIAKSRTEMSSWPIGAVKSDYRRSEGMSGGQAGAKTFRFDMKDVPNPDSTNWYKYAWASEAQSKE